MFNSVCFQGNLVRDTEFADTRDSDIVNFTIASSRKFKDKEEVTYVDCTAYGKTAVNIGKYFKKGSPIGVEGRLSQNNWEDRDGNKRSKIYITVNSFHFTGNTDSNRDSSRGGSRGSGCSDGGGRSREDSRGGSGRGRDNDRGQRGNNSRSDGGGRKDYDEKIPF